MRNFTNRAREALKSTAAKVGTAGSALVASAGAMAATGPGGSIAAELSSGKSEVMLVVAAAAVIIGVLVLWAYVKRAR